MSFDGDNNLPLLRFNYVRHLALRELHYVVFESTYGKHVSDVRHSGCAYNVTALIIAIK